MMFRPIGLRYNSGKTFTTFDPLKSLIFTASVEGKLRVFNHPSDSNPKELNLQDRINCLLSLNNDLVVGTESSNVFRLHIDDFSVGGVITRFTAGVTCLAPSKDKNRLLAGSSDFTIKCVDLMSNDSSRREVVFRGHTGPILSVDCDPLGVYGASSSCDGTVRIWALGDSTEAKVFSILERCSDIDMAKSMCKLKWEPIHGSYLVVPVQDKLHVYSRKENWKIKILENAALTGDIRECEFSPNFENFATVGAGNQVGLWDLEKGALLHLKVIPLHGKITSMIWPESNTIYCGDDSGTAGFFLLSFLSPKAIANEETDTNTGLSNGAINELFGDADSVDFDELNKISTDQSNHDEKVLEVDEENSLAVVPDPSPVEEADVSDDDDDLSTVAISRIKSAFLDTLDLNDEGTRLTATDGDRNEAHIEGTPVAVQQVEEIKSFQPGSMPTGFRERFLVWNHVGIVTLFGVNETDERASSSIEVEFHDTTFHHSLHFDAQDFTMADLNATAVMLASPGSDDTSLVDAFDNGSAVAESDLSTVLVRPLGGGAHGQDLSSDWTVSLPPGEACRAISLVIGGEAGLAVVATSMRYLRVFLQPPASSQSQGGGVQLLQVNSIGLPPISLPGREVVTMTSHPYLPILAVVVGQSNEDLHWRVYNLSSSNGTPRGWAFGRLSSTFYPLPLSPASHLSWLGFSDVGNLYAHDSKGCLRRLSHHSDPDAPQNMDFHWVPVCDTRRCVKPQNRMNDHFFVVGVVEAIEQPLENKKTLDVDEDIDARSKQMKRIREDELGFGQVQAIYCKASRWPRPVPRPIVSTLALRLPLCGVYETDQGSLEENYLRTRVLDQKPFWGVSEEALRDLSSNHSRSQKKALLRLFAFALKLENEWAAMTVAGLMPDVETVRLAIRYALRINKSALAEKIGRIALELEEREEGDEADCAVEECEQEEMEGEEEVDGDEEQAEGYDKEEDGKGASDDEAGEILGDENAMEILGETGVHDRSMISTTSTLEANTSVASSRFNPFKRSTFDIAKSQFGGRGSCALDTLKPAQQQPRATKPAKPPTQGRAPHPKTKESGSSGQQRPLKRPAGGVPERATKRLSAFAFSPKPG